MCLCAVLAMTSIGGAVPIHRYRQVKPVGVSTGGFGAWSARHDANGGDDDVQSARLGRIHISGHSYERALPIVWDDVLVYSRLVNFSRRILPCTYFGILLMIVKGTDSERERESGRRGRN